MGVGLARRLPAGIVDGLIVIAAMAALVLAARRLGAVQPALTVVATALPLVYFLIFEGYDRPTPGKRLFGLTVVTVDGAPVGFTAALVRALTRVPEALVVVPYVALIAFSARHQRLGDMVAETLVVPAGGPRRAARPARGDDSSRPQTTRRRIKRRA